jgi:hypothetical protein
MKLKSLKDKPEAPPKPPKNPYLDIPGVETTPYGIPVLKTATADEDIIVDDQGDQALLSLIPLLSGSSNKARYLSYRATGFPVKQAAVLAGVRKHQVALWRKNDKEFLRIEMEELPKLQKTVAKDVLLMEFDMNLRLAMHADYRVLYKAATAPGTMSEEELTIYKAARPHYTPKSRMDLENAVKPPEERTQGDLNVTVLIDGREAEDRASYQAGLAKILKQFEYNKEIAERTIEGEFKEVVPDEV